MEPDKESIIKSSTENRSTENSSTEQNHIAKTGKKKFIIWFLVSLFAMLLIIYFGVMFYFQSHFLPHTTVSGQTVDYFTVSEAAHVLENQTHAYRLEVIGRIDEHGAKAVLGEITAEEIQLEPIDVLTTAHDVLAEQNSFLWFFPVFGNVHQDYSVEQGVTFEEDLLEEVVEAWDAFQNENMIHPEDAYIGRYNEKMQEYEIVPETKGTRLERQAAVSAIKDAILIHKPEIDLEEAECYLTAKVTAENKALNDKVNRINFWLKSKITYDWNGTEVVIDAGRIHEWIQVDTVGVPSLDREAIAQFVRDTSKELDTYGKNRKFTTSLGVELTLPGGAYGWKTDRDGETEELMHLIQQGSILEKEPLYISRGAQKGREDIGSSYVEIDLSNQHLYLYQEGEIVLETDFVSGKMTQIDTVTPPGVFGLTYKTKDAVLRGENYETPVSYWMPFNGNIGMHDATWRTSFGGTIYLTNGSHGCINLPLRKAKEIYRYVKTGFPIVCYYY